MTPDVLHHPARPRLDVAIAIAAIVGGFAFVTPTPRPAPSHPAISAAAGQPASGKAGTLETASGTDGATARTGTPGQSAGAPPTAPAGAPPLHSRQASRTPAPTASPRAARTARPAARVVTARAAGRVTGVASWYCGHGSPCTIGYGPGCLCAAASPRLRSAIGPDWRGTEIRVTSHGSSVLVSLVDECGCPDGRLVDLYASVWQGFGVPLSAGLMEVTVSWS